MSNNSQQNSDPSSRRFSKIEPHREFLMGLWNHDETISCMQRALAKKGCAVAYETLRGWLRREIQAGGFPARKKSRIGRPTKRAKEAVSLGLLPNDDGDNDKRDQMQFLLWNLHAGNPLATGANNALAFRVQQTGIPLTDEDEPDYVEYAKQLGARRVRTLGDMDYYLLASWLKEWRSHPKYGTSSWQSEVLLAAARLRAEMLTAVGLV